jgi:hypothetical protein
VLEAVKKLKPTAKRPRDLATNSNGLSPSELNIITEKVTAEVSSKLDEKVEAFCIAIGRTFLITLQVVSNVVHPFLHRLFHHLDITPKPIAFKQNYLKSQSKFISCSLQTGANVPEKLKNQIWGGKYIDFHLLLENDAGLLMHIEAVNLFKAINHRLKVRGFLCFSSSKENSGLLPSRPQGVCFSFHRGKGCKFGSNCKYQHQVFQLWF